MVKGIKPQESHHPQNDEREAEPKCALEKRKEMGQKPSMWDLTRDESSSPKPSAWR